MKIKDRKIVIFNQAVNYLTIGLANEFANKFEEVSLITGSIHEQGESLDPNIKVDKINPWKEEHGFGKLINYIKALTSIWFKLLFKYPKYEVFFVSVPPMGYLLNIILPHRFSMIIWDVYPDGLKITGMRENHIVYKVWSKLNKISFRKAFRLFTISELMADLLSVYVERTKIIVQPIWSIFQKNEKIDKKDNKFIKIHGMEGEFIVQYSGNIGLTHKVETMVALAEKMQGNTDIVFQIIGRGPRKKALERLVKEKNLSNCEFLPFQTDEMFPYSLSAADLGVVILDEVTSKGSVPSKSYNLMSYGIPSLYIAAEDSELNNYVKTFEHGACYSEQELEQAEKFILRAVADKDFYQKLSMKSIEASKHFKRENAAKFVKKYLE